MDEWRVEAHFKQIGLSRRVDMGTRDEKRAAYARVADALMSGGIERVIVYRNAQEYQTITVREGKGDQAQ